MNRPPALPGVTLTPSADFHADSMSLPIDLS